MPKIIQPLSDADDIRGEAEAATREKFTNYYVDAPAPDPLDFHPPATTTPGQPESAQGAAENSSANPR
jgi:hypothetical protein